MWGLTSITMLKELTDDELIIEYLLCANQLSYYNAAEGSDWYTETNARKEAKKQFDDVKKEIADRKIIEPTGDWLL